MIFFRNILCISYIFSLIVFALGRHSVKIIEGGDADIRDFPYMAALTEVGRVISCGAAIINENTLLTAAHCLLDEKLSWITIKYGSTIFQEGIETNVSQAYIHKNFKNTTPPMTDDIAVLKVDPPIVFSETVQPIKLPQKNVPNPAGKLAKFAGWGKTNDTYYVQSNILQKVDMTIIDDKTCEEIWKNTTNPVDTEKEICAQADMSDGKRRGPCYGDSGSPLVIDGVQYGIISSFHDGCGIAEYPIVYTRVAHYLDWLSDKI